MDRPATRRDVHEQLLHSLEEQGLDRSALLNILTYIMKTYVIDRTIPLNLPLPEEDGTPGGEAGRGEPKLDFVRLIQQLKERTDIPELRYFSIEDGKVTLRVDNQKVTFGEKVTFEFTPVSTTPAARPERESGERPATGKPPAEQTLSEVERDALHDVMQRFKRLDLD